MVFFFFTQKTVYEMRISDWSSDVCSSDLAPGHAAPADPRVRNPGRQRAGRPDGPGSPCLYPARLVGGAESAAAGGSAGIFRLRPRPHQLEGDRKSGL